MKRWIGIGILTAVIIGAAVAIPAFAQDQPGTPPQGPNTGSMQPARPIQILVCSTTSPTDVVAKALGMSPADLRLALVSGKTISQIAASNNIDMQVVRDALTAQRQADLDQALKDGLITQAEYDQITAAMKNAPTTTGNGRTDIRVPAYNTVNQEAVAAQALGMTCADLVKATQDGTSIAEVAANKGIAVQTVIDAVIAAHKAALDADVKEGLITQAEADGRLTRLNVEVGQWVYSTHPMMGPRNGMGGQMGGPGGQRGGQNGQGNQQRGNQQPATPAAPATPNT